MHFGLTMRDLCITGNIDYYVSRPADIQLELLKDGQKQLATLTVRHRYMYLNLRESY